MGEHLDALVRRALTAFGRSEARALDRLAASNRNDNWLVEAPFGERFVLRRCRRNREFERTRWQVALQQHLWRAGYPVPEVLLAPAGDAVVDLEDVPWTLQRFVEGEHHNYARTAQAEAAGTRLAEFHLLAAGFRESPRHEVGLHFREYWTEDDVGVLRGRFGDALRAELDEFAAWLDVIRAAWPLERFDALPAGLNHGDWHGRNVLFRDDAIVAVLDYDLAEPGPWALDVVDGMIHFAREARGSRIIRPAVGRAFLRAYESVRPLTREEREAMPALAPLLEAPFAAYVGMAERYGEDPLADVRAHLEMWRSVVDRRGVLGEVCGG